MLSNTRKYLILFFLLFHSCVLLLASDAPVHNSQLLQVLFGRGKANLNYFEAAQKEKLVMLEKALFLAIDEYNGYHLTYLDDLRTFGVENLPQASQIDFTSNLYHQRATHRGWDFTTYPSDVQRRWELRKQILLSTIDKIFVFQPNEMIKKDSFAALLYYTHILSDHIGDSKRTYTSRMRLNGSMRGRNMERLDIIWELKYHTERLFREQTNQPDYKMLMRYLNRHESKPKVMYAQTISDKNFKGVQSFAKKILDNLVKYIPPLLKNEPFFTRNFP